MNRYDINCDLGEGYGIHRFSDENDIMPFINSCNVACGLHAGDPDIILNTIDTAINYDIKIGAHPGYNDRRNFGRVSQELSIKNLENLLIYQIGLIEGILKFKKMALHHVKLHGALYHDVAKDKVKSEIFCEICRGFSPTLIIYGPPSSELMKQAASKGLEFWGEGFFDRKYKNGFELTNRSEFGSVIQETQLAFQNLAYLEDIDVNREIKTLCVHGDNPSAIKLVSALKESMRNG